VNLYHNLIHNLEEFILSEQQARSTELRRLWARPLAERVLNGRAIENLSVEQVGGDGTVRLRCPTNESRFREGDYLTLHRGDPTGQESLLACLEYDDETELEVFIRSGNLTLLLDLEEGWIVDEGNLDLTAMYLDALDEAGDTLHGRENILPLLAGDRHPVLDYELMERASQQAIDAGLNASQAEALGEAYATDLAYLIQGPPGTGKTMVLAQLARQLVKIGERVFVTGLTHRAINNALNKIYRLDPALPVCKIGIPSQTRDLQVPNYGNFAESGFGDLPCGYIVGATPFATRSQRLSHVEFDTVLFDESSQITLPLAIMGMLPARRYIFIGDDKQLPPVVTSGSTEFGRASIFSYLAGRGYEKMLTTTYRLNRELADWPSRQFYHGELLPDEGVAGRRLALVRQPRRWAFALDPEVPLVFLDTGRVNTTIRSESEADAACDLVLELLACGIPPQEIGVVTPYRAQGRAIRSRLRALLPSRQALHALVVDTVERMQGQEREVVIVSLATAQASFASQLADFFFQPQRLNVAITRPRSKLIILASRQLLNARPDNPEHLVWVEMLGDLLTNCREYHLPAWKIESDG
jgi:DNA replication ATP-dependent helicase Dna2